MSYLPGRSFTARELAEELGMSYAWVTDHKNALGGRNLSGARRPRWMFEAGDVARALATNPDLRPRLRPSGWHEAIEAHR